MQKYNWKKSVLGKHISVLTDYHANGSYKKLKANVELLDEPNYAVMIRTTNFERDDFKDNLRYITKHAYEFLHKSKVYPRDILMNKIANAGSVYLMPDLKRPVSLAMNLFLIRTKPETTNQVFVYYYLKANEEYIKTFATGTASQTINKKAVRQLEITLPPLNIQSRIANFLLSYEKLIEINKQRIKILEEIAQLLYHQWFECYRFPGYENIRLVNSGTEFEEIPEGWEISELSKYVDFVRGVEPGSKNYEHKFLPGYIPFLRVGDLGKRSSGIFIKRNLAKGRELNYADIAITLDGTIGLVGIGLKGAYSSGIRKAEIIPNSPLKRSFIYLELQSDRMQAKIKAHAKGTTILHASSAIGNMDFVLHDKNTLNLFDNFVEPIIQQILLLKNRVEVLEVTRDFLTPKIVSGEFDLSNLSIDF